MKKDDALAALVTQPLTPFEGRDVLKAAIEIPGAAGGLREAMQFEPVELHTGEEVFVLLKTTVGKVRFDPIKDAGVDTGTYSRVHVLDASEATFVDGAFAEEHLAGQRERIKLLREKAQGVSRLDDPEHGLGADWDEDQRVLATQHRTGVHADGLRDGCPLCGDEINALREEAQ